MHTTPCCVGTFVTTSSELADRDQGIKNKNEVS